MAWLTSLLLLGAAQPSEGARRINPIDGAEMVYLRGGEFLMGSDSGEIDRMWSRLGWDPEEKAYTKGEQPAHRVRVAGFWIYRDDVTVAQYRRFCRATRRSMPPTPFFGWKDDHPVVNVSWDDAKAYCAWAKARLPYEAEWEYAARGGGTGLPGKPRKVFVWGDDLPRTPVANLADESFKTSRLYHSSFHLFAGYRDGYPHTSPVDAFPPNGYGLRDMAGNVWQWCEDWSGDDYYRRSPSTNPRGPVRGRERVLRGGAFDTTPTITRVARRIKNFPHVRHEEKGFRCVYDSPRPRGKRSPTRFSRIPNSR